jgi:type I restriction-modification system DNA methylase subunit
MHLLKPEGVLAMVLPSYFMDNTQDHVRNIIHQEGGSLVAAYRLPEDLFRDAKVTIDIVFLKKGKTDKTWLLIWHC